MSTQADSAPPVTAIFDALVEGLRTANRSLNDKCSAALRVIGEGIVPFLEQVAADQSTRNSHRQRLLDAIELINSDGPDDISNAYSAMVALFEMLRSQNVRLNELATKALRALPEGIALNELIREAIRNYRKEAYCLRLIAAAGQMEGPLSTDNWMDINFMVEANKWSYDVSFKAAGLMLKNRFKREATK